MDSTPSPPIVNEQSTDLAIFLAIQAQQVKALDVLYDRACYNQKILYHFETSDVAVC